MKRRLMMRIRIGFMMLLAALFLVFGFMTIRHASITAFAGSASEQTEEAVQTGNVSYTTYVVHKGDTLWSIADNYHESVYDNAQDYINEIIRANGLKGSAIYEGQLLIIPCQESPSYLCTSDHSSV